MANMLGITNPVPGQDHTNVGKNVQIAPTDPRIQNAIDPSKVMKGDGKTEQQNAGQGDGMKKLQFDSNFGAFFQKLHQSKDLSETLGAQLLRYSTGDMGGTVAVELAQMMQMLKMDKGELLSFLTDQMNSGNRFSGALFNALREAFSGSTSEAMKNDILQFLKSYTDHTSTDHIETNIMRTMDKLTRAVPASFGNKLATLVGELSDLLKGAGTQVGQGGSGQEVLEGEEGRQDPSKQGTLSDPSDRQAAIKLLQGKIIPFLGDYTRKTHDMGLARTLISVLSYNIARLEGGSEEQLLANFHQLNTHVPLHNKLGGLSDDALLKLIKNSTFMQSSTQNEFANHLIEATSEAMTGDSGSELQEVFKEVLNTYLLNESVFMPINHLTIPLDWFDKFMFSQVWVDPDAEDSMKRGQEDSDPIVKVLIKMDIEDLGLFDLILATQNDNAEMLIHCPEVVSDHADIVQKELSLILRDNGFTPQSVHVGKLEVPISLATVFPKIYESENSVDVKA